MEGQLIKNKRDRNRHYKEVILVIISINEQKQQRNSKDWVIRTGQTLFLVISFEERSTPMTYQGNERQEESARRNVVNEKASKAERK